MSDSTIAVLSSFDHYTTFTFGNKTLTFRTCDGLERYTESIGTVLVVSPSESSGRERSQREPSPMTPDDSSRPLASCRDHALRFGDHRGGQRRAILVVLYLALGRLAYHFSLMPSHRAKIGKLHARDMAAFFVNDSLFHDVHPLLSL